MERGTFIKQTWKISGKLLASVVLGLGLGSTQGLAWQHVTVDDDGPADFSSIQAAIDAVPANSTIRIRPGTYLEHLVIDKDLRLLGGDEALTIVDGDHAGRVLRVSAGANVKMSRMTLQNGRAFSDSDPEGAGILNFGTLTLQRCSLTGNVAFRRGGAILNFGDLELVLCTVSKNFADPLGGGAGIYNEGRLIVRRTSITNNGSAEGSGGIQQDSANSLMVVFRSTISGNKAGHGFGGGINNADTGGPILLVDSTISGNEADEGVGGGIYGGNLEIRNCTITDNLATRGPFTSGRFARGGGLFSTGNVTLFSTILALNHVQLQEDGTETGPDCFGEITSHGYNLIGNGKDSTMTPAIADQIGTPSAPIDPLLGPLQDNGGPTFTHALLHGSPAIDQGKGRSLETDQRGFPRTVNIRGVPNAGDGTDIGAFELSAKPHGHKGKDKDKDKDDDDDDDQD